jgi:hypothetical protein
MQQSLNLKLPWSSSQQKQSNSQGSPRTAMHHGQPATLMLQLLSQSMSQWQQQQQQHLRQASNMQQRRRLQRSTR